MGILGILKQSVRKLLITNLNNEASRQSGGTKVT